MSDHNAKRDEARERVKGWLDKPEHKAKKGDARDEQTREDRLDDPAKQQEGDPE